MPIWLEQAADGVCEVTPSAAKQDAALPEGARLAEDCGLVAAGDAVDALQATCPRPDLLPEVLDRSLRPPLLREVSHEGVLDAERWFRGALLHRERRAEEASPRQA